MHGISSVFWTVPDAQINQSVRSIAQVLGDSNTEDPAQALGTLFWLSALGVRMFPQMVLLSIAAVRVHAGICTENS